MKIANNDENLHHMALRAERWLLWLPSCQAWQQKQAEFLVSHAEKRGLSVGLETSSSVGCQCSLHLDVCPSTVISTPTLALTRRASDLRLHITLNMNQVGKDAILSLYMYWEDWLPGRSVPSYIIKTSIGIIDWVVHIQPHFLLFMLSYKAAHYLSAIL